MGVTDGARLAGDAPPPKEVLGFDAEFQKRYAEAAKAAELGRPAQEIGTFFPGRVIREDRGYYVLAVDECRQEAELSGSLKRRARQDKNYPTVGDWVVVEQVPGEERFMVADILPRKTWFSRQRAGHGCEEQVVAANIDIVWIVVGLDHDFNLRRLERYLTLAHGGGIEPVVLLNKADCCDAVAEAKAKAQSVAKEVPIEVISALHGSGIDALGRYLKSGQSLAIMGSSGVGKSTLVNTLVGHGHMETAAARASDSRGRHTTVHRELVFLPDGITLIDTPGMRELQMWGDAEALGQSFPDINELAATCRFADCSHAHEPHCAVRQAVEEGALDSERLQAYQDLSEEFAHTQKRLQRHGKSERRAPTKRPPRKPPKR